MTDGAVGLITNVLREHARGGTLFEDKNGLFYRCKCGEPTYVESGAPGFAEHVAREVNAALGGLTREVGAGFRGSQNITPVAKGLTASDFGPNWTVGERWVSGWTPEESTDAQV